MSAFGRKQTYRAAGDAQSGQISPDFGPSGGLGIRGVSWICHRVLQVPQPHADRHLSKDGYAGRSVTPHFAGGFHSADCFLCSVGSTSLYASQHPSLSTASRLLCGQ